MKAFVLVYLALLTGYSSSINIYYLDSYCYGNNRSIDLPILDSVRLRLTDSDYYSNHLNCSVTLTSSSKKQLIYFFKSFDVESSPYCQADFLEMHDGRSLSSPFASGFYGKQCGSHISQSVYTTSNRALAFWFKSDNRNTGKGFDIIITSYHTGPCDSTEYICNNGRCVDKYLTCNGYNPCGDNSDCAHTDGGINITIAGYAGIAAGIVVAFIITTFVTCVIGKRCRRASDYGMY